MSVVRALLQVLRTEKGAVTVPWLAATTGFEPALVASALEELVRRGKLVRATSQCRSATCPLHGKCSAGCSNCAFGQHNPQTECTEGSYVLAEHPKRLED